MKLNNKLRELRISRNMTQQEVAEQLGVSSQTVSKWERCLLSPDISLLPKIALLFRCSIDSLFDMDVAWGIEHRREFKAKIDKLRDLKDWNGIYDAWIREIELNPDYYQNYPSVMFHVLRKKFFDDEHVQKMLSLAEHAEKYCMDGDIRNQIYLNMLQICYASENPKIKEKTKTYYENLPMLRHSREVYAKFVMDTDNYHRQMKENIIYLIDIAECSVRQLIKHDMKPEEKLYYYKKAAALYETVLDDKYAGFWDPPLLSDYMNIAVLLLQLGKVEEAREYVNHILRALEKHISDDDKKINSQLLYTTFIPNTVPTEQLCENLLNDMLRSTELEPFKESISDMLERYKKYFANKKR